MTFTLKHIAGTLFASIIKQITRGGVERNVAGRGRFLALLQFVLLETAVGVKHNWILIRNFFFVRRLVIRNLDMLVLIDYWKLLIILTFEISDAIRDAHILVILDVSFLTELVASSLSFRTRANLSFIFNDWFIHALFPHVGRATAATGAEVPTWRRLTAVEASDQVKYL